MNKDGIGIHAANVRLSQQQIIDLAPWGLVKLLAVDHLDAKDLIHNATIIVRTSSQGDPNMKMVDELRPWAATANVIFEIDNEPDWYLPKTSWYDAIWEYRYKLLQILPALKALGKPLISPALAFPIYNQEEMTRCYAFNSICTDVFKQFDFIGLHRYSGTHMLDGALKDLDAYSHRQFPGKTAYVTEYGMDPAWHGNKLNMYQMYLNYLAQDKLIKGATMFIQHGSYNWHDFELSEKDQYALSQTKLAINVQLPSV